MILRFRTADDIIRFQRAALDRRNGVATLSLEGIKGYHYERACVFCSCEKWVEKHVAGVDIPVCSHCGENWLVSEVHLPRNLFTGQRAHDAIAEVMAEELTVSVLLKRAEEDGLLNFTALVFHVGLEESYEGVARRLYKRWPIRCAGMTIARARRMVRDGRRAVERRFRAVGLLYEEE